MSRGDTPFEYDDQPDDSSGFAADDRETDVDIPELAPEQRVLLHDAAHVWHPYTQHHQAPMPTAIARASGSWLYDMHGKPILDAISSWWVTTHGHCHPDIIDAIAEQARTLDQVMFAGFTHEPAATLAKYTLNPRFRAALGRYTRQDLDTLIAPWAKRFSEAGIVGGYGSDATYGTANFSMSVTKEEYRAIAAQKRWGPVPAPIKLDFSQSLAFPAVDGRIAPLLRHFASERRATVIQLEAGASGRIFLRDGCLRMGRIGTAEPSSLAMFHKETGIGLDAQGYLALIDRTTGRPTGRVGEMFSWGAPNGAREDMPEVIALHVACGPGGVINVGNPESKFAFDRKYRHN